MSANDSDEFVKRETDWLNVPLRENRPFLGICLGAQMLVNHLGGKVEGHGDGLVEIGWYPITPTEEGKALMHWPEMVYQFHREGFSLPSGRDAAGHRRDLSQPGFPLRRQSLGHPVSRRADGDDDASLGGARRASVSNCRARSPAATISAAA